MKPIGQRVATGFFALMLTGSLAACGSSKSTRELIEILQQRDNGAFSAALSLGKKKDPQAIAALVAALGYDDAQLRQAALMGLDGIDDPQAIKAIVLALQDGDSSVREEAQRALEFVIGQGYHSVEPAIAQLHDQTPQSLDPLVDSLQEMLADASSFDRPKILAALGQTRSDRAVEPILAALKGDDTELRSAAVEALGKMGSDRAVDALIAVFEKNQAGLQETAAVALAKTNRPRALDVLLVALKQEGTQGIAVKALGYSGDKRAIAALVDLIQDPDSPLQEAAGQALGQVGSPAVDALLPGLQHEDPRVKANVAIALGTIGDAKAIAPLTANLTDWFANQATAKALQQLGWNPQSDRDTVHLFVAQRQGASLNQQWETTKTVLLEDVGSGNARAIENALFAFIGLGQEEIVSILIDKLEAEGDKEMALVYLNCGHPQLEAAAKTWAERNGYEVYSQPGASRTVAWGTL